MTDPHPDHPPETPGEEKGGLPRVLEEAFVQFGGAPLTPDERARLSAFTEFADASLATLGYDVDRRARPYLQAHDVGGGDLDQVWLSPAHREALREIYATGVATGPLEGRHSWPFTFAIMHQATDVGCLCSATVTLATVFSLVKYGSPALKARVLGDVLRDGARAQGGTWATEAQGGSDLGANRTRAVSVSGDLWHLTGEKYFCSNVGAGYAVLSARPEGGPPGVKGIRLFFAAARRSDGRANWRIRRLKEKLGTTSVPTGEVSLEASEAVALGTPEIGILPVMEMLNVSRIANAVGSAGLVHQVFRLARDHARHRVAFGKALADHPLLALDLARLAAEADAATLLAMEAAFRFQAVWKEPPPYSPAFHLLRLSTHAAKMVTAEQAVRCAYLAMEVLGGPGYMEEYPVAKLVRDALVLPIWEGGANLQSLDAREVMERYHPEGAWLEAARRAASETTIEPLRAMLASRLSVMEGPSSEASAKVRLRSLGELRQATLLWERARSRPSDPESALAIAELFAREHGSPDLHVPPGPLIEAVLRRAA